MRIKKVVDYQNYLVESLKDPEEAIGYLNAALEGGDISAFLLALQNVVKATGGISEIAGKTNKSRTSLYKTISKKGNPYLKSVNDIILALGMRIVVHGIKKQTVRNRGA